MLNPVSEGPELLLSVRFAPSEQPLLGSRNVSEGSTPVIERNPNVRVKIGQRQPESAKNSVPSPSKSSSLALAGLC